VAIAQRGRIYLRFAKQRIGIRAELCDDLRKLMQQIDTHHCDAAVMNAQISLCRR